MGTQLTPLGPEGLGLGQSRLPTTLSPSCLHPLLQAGVGGRVGPRVSRKPLKALPSRDYSLSFHKTRCLTPGRHLQSMS